MFMRIRALKRNVQKQYSSLRSKEYGINVCYAHRTMDLIISCQLGATVNSSENVTCKENIFFNL